ncbi:unnamed protein product [Ambrosiozyma monospora]|uniref:Unnamed protein product n=1 Tax=Ambrosiozyma monospora TaxID=43982 RepID=A0ACB5U4D2_AMBMO|nr:unnamed protein product [Ambrosiozyma monospora]
MPNSIEDFKGHPIYVLENQLHANEILRPKESCGTVRKKSGKTNTLIPVYKRANVQLVRSAKAWYMLGRVLKIGERPLKIKEKSKMQQAMNVDFEGDGDEDDDVRLYAEYQTELFDPPIVEDGGDIPTNAYGNIDIYQPWMIPGGCVHVPNKFAAKAAKLINVKFAPAAVGFDFGGKKSRMRGNATVRIEGIVVSDEFEEAVLEVCSYLEEQEQEEKTRRKELLALRAWKLVLAKLKIQKRLNEEHGEVDDDEKGDQSDDGGVGADDSGEEGGGFVGEDEHYAMMMEMVKLVGFSMMIMVDF